MTISINKSKNIRGIIWMCWNMMFDVKLVAFYLVAVAYRLFKAYKEGEIT